MTKTITFSEARELGIPNDILRFAQESPGSRGPLPIAVDSLQRDAKVREFMREHPGVSYYGAFRVVCMGADPTDIDSFAEGVNDVRKRRSNTVTRTLEALLGIRTHES